MEVLLKIQQNFDKPERKNPPKQHEKAETLLPKKASASQMGGSLFGHDLLTSECQILKSARKVMFWYHLEGFGLVQIWNHS